MVPMVSFRLCPCLKTESRKAERSLQEIKRQLGLYEVMVLRQLIAKRGMLPEKMKCFFRQHLLSLVF
ncbi:hypothetical protein AN664_0225765 [Serratia marcescens]|nr:hypothetical protein AN699_0226510 [Serratia marcescens]OKB63286.1 hypothetical protein A9F06_28280 [Klebsiella pneumoniae]OCN54816.1 hypothetical protein AN665_0225045 [Serratia marcescens]OCN54925.1 hypothetical protein AN664_0225765 [Serratia marcescens]OCO52315.1 hypothetical protein AN686_0225820 [Serratia marcescens]